MPASDRVYGFGGLRGLGAFRASGVWRLEFGGFRVQGSGGFGFRVWGFWGSRVRDKVLFGSSYSIPAQFLRL